MIQKNYGKPLTIALAISILLLLSEEAPSAGPSRFVPITPCRSVDTRNANGPFGGPALASQTSRDFVIPNGSCGIPGNATAYSLNATVYPPGPLGYLTLWPTGQAKPLVWTMTSLDGRTKSNAAIVPAGTNGAISAFVTDASDLVVDINGYFVRSNDISALEFYPITPCRTADTRLANGPLGGPVLPAGGTRTFPILSGACGVPGTAQAYSFNFVAIPQGSLQSLVAWPTGRSRPTVLSLTAPRGNIVTNAVIAASGTDGGVDVYSTDATHLVIDINGYFAPAGTGSLAFNTAVPCRVLDSRLPAGTPPFSSTKIIDVTSSSCSVPATAKAYVFNATVVPPGPLGYLTLWPTGQSQPIVSTLNSFDGAITSNMAIVPTTIGSISAFPKNPTHLVLDIFGYFGGTPPTPDPMTWEVEPHPIAPASISMTCTTATDFNNPPVYYFFNFVGSPTGGNGGTDSGWDNSTSYTNPGLDPNHQYGFRVKAGDSSPARQETGYSPIVYKYTLAKSPGTFSYSDITPTSIRANWTFNGNRSGTEYFCENITKGANSGWTTNTYWDSNGLAPGNFYIFRVKARNGDGFLTGWTDLGSQDTLPHFFIYLPLTIK